MPLLPPDKLHTIYTLRARAMPIATCHAASRCYFHAADADTLLPFSPLPRHTPCHAFVSPSAAIDYRAADYDIAAIFAADADTYASFADAAMMIITRARCR